MGGFVKNGTVTPAAKPMDRLEACLVAYNCLGGNCTSTVQNSVVQFLKCFEGENGRGKSETTARTCAGTVGIDFDPVHKCFGSKVASDAAMASVLKISQASKGMKCLPWVLINGKVFSDPASEDCVPANYSKELLKSICAAYTGSKPAGCN